MSYRRGMGQDCSGGSSSACSWYDNIWATQGCLDWYAACDPTNAFYLTNTKGLIVGGSQAVGQTVGGAVAAAGNAVLGIDTSTGNGIPQWIWVAGAALLALMVVPELIRR